MSQHKEIGNRIIRNMILDCLIIRLAINGKNIPAPLSQDIERLIKRLQNRKTNHNYVDVESISIHNIQYMHPLIAINYNVAQLSTKLCAELCLDIVHTKHLTHFINFVKANKEFAIEMHIFLRSILLSIENLVLLGVWIDILELLLASVKENSNLASGTIYFMLYLLAKEVDGRKQMELLRGLTSFSGVKENIPLILNTYRSLSSSTSTELQIISIDLHTRLWFTENRTYQFLHKILITEDDKLSVPNKWEMNVVKAYTIKKICEQK